MDRSIKSLHLDSILQVVFAVIDKRSDESYLEFALLIMT